MSAVLDGAVRRWSAGLAAGLAGLFLAACGDKAPPPPPPVPVVVATAERQDVPLELPATGTVEPLQAVSVQAQVSGIITRVGFKEGDDVSKGQMLFQLDPRPYQAALSQAQAVLERDKAQLANARADAQRYESLVQKQYVTAQQFQQVKTDAAALAATVSADEAAVEQARLNLQYATIRSPLNGRAGALLVREGNLVRANTGTPLVVVNQIHPILVRFALPAAQLPQIQRYRDSGIVVVAEPAQGGTESKGTLSFLDNAVDTTTGTILLKGSFPNTDNALWPGEFVRVRARLTTERNSLVVPAPAVVSGQKGNFVFVIRKDGTAIARPVQVRRTTATLAVLDGGIEAGDRVVTDGQIRLRDGAKVQIKAAPVDTGATPRNS
ncbi:MAG TPA: efflux RND transporter periplasmic adaptor subunit [Gemmatimonadales bacterium]|nr:efflux RND transporter periplasmic adaptor subunit [Gemmatimonadales bacterium]